MKEAYEKFVKEYVKTGDATKSALAAGSLERLAESDGKRWLEKTEIQEAIAEAKGEPKPPKPAPRKRVPSKRVTRKK